MIYAIVLGSLFLVYYLRKYWLSPWATYVSHSELKKSKGTFLTVSHIRWYPPFLRYNETYYRSGTGKTWVSEATGRKPITREYMDIFPWPKHQDALSGIFSIAMARDDELKELTSL